MNLLRLCFLSVLLIGSPFVAANEEQQSPRELAQTLLAAYVFVASGSGVIISPDGLVVSNHHVTGDQGPLTVRLAGGASYEATLLGINPVGDISVLKIDSDHPLPYVPLASEEDFRLGMPVFAVGNPFALGDRDDIPSLSFGHLSTLRVVRGNYADCIQVDAPVNPGNSGGPLLSMDGKLLGINGQIRTRSGMRANSGIGLAISAVQLAEFIPVLAASNGGFAHHCAIPEDLELSDEAGTVVVSASGEGSPLRVGDRLLNVHGRSATSVDTAIGLFQAPVWTPGRSLQVRVLRDGVEEEFAVPVARTPIPGRPWHGITIRMESGVQIGNRQHERIARIRSIDEDSPAERAGISEGTYVLAVNDQPITRALDIIRAFSGSEVGDTVNLHLLDTDGSEAQHTITLRARP